MGIYNTFPASKPLRSQQDFPPVDDFLALPLYDAFKRIIKEPLFWGVMIIIIVLLLKK